MPATFQSVPIDGTQHTVVELTGRTENAEVPLEIGSDWNTLNISYRISWKDDGGLPHNGITFVHPEVFVGVCARGKPWFPFGNAMAWGYLLHNYSFVWNGPGHETFYVVIDGRSMENGVNTKPDVGNVTYMPRADYSLVSDTYLIQLSKTATAPNWFMKQMFTRDLAFIGNPVTQDRFRSGLVTANQFETRNIWQDYGATVDQPQPKRFSAGGVRSPMDEASYGALDSLCLYWDMMNSGHACYIYDLHVNRID